MTVRPHWNYKTREQDRDNHAGLISEIRSAFQQVDDFKEAQEHFYGGLADRRLSDNRAYATIVRAAQRGVINKTKVLTLANEWQRQATEPQVETCDFEWHPEFMPRNAYSLFNAFTQVEKERLAKNPVASNISTIDLSGL